MKSANTNAADADQSADAGPGMRLKQLRLAQGLSLRGLAERSGVTVGAVSQIENGKTSPSVSTSKKLVAALGTTLGEFFSEDQSEPREHFVYRAAQSVNVTAGPGFQYLGLPGAATERAL